MTAWRQLDLYKDPRRQRGTLPSGPSEFEIHCTVADYLRHGLAKGWTWHHPPNGGERPAKWIKGRRISIEGGRLKRMGARPGVSDICLHKSPHCQLHALEIKRKGEQPSDEQLAWMTEVKALGGKADWADSVEGALEILKVWGAIRTTIEVAA